MSMWNWLKIFDTDGASEERGGSSFICASPEEPSKQKSYVFYSPSGAGCAVFADSYEEARKAADKILMPPKGESNE